MKMKKKIVYFILFLLHFYAVCSVHSIDFTKEFFFISKSFISLSLKKRKNTLKQKKSYIFKLKGDFPTAQIKFIKIW